MAEINNYFVAAGMNSSGVASAGGVGKLVAIAIVTGHLMFSLSKVQDSIIV